MDTPSSLHEYKLHKQTALIHKFHTLIHFSALLALFYYRISSFFSSNENSEVSTVSLLLNLVSELILSFQWLLRVSLGWRRITRTVYPERLPPDEQLPAIDVFVFTADPEKEPPLGVMNTVISAMALDYPPDKVSVYLSDDAGSELTLYAIHEAWNFASLWIPFCRKYGIRTRCPGSYFRVPDEDSCEGSPDFLEERGNMEKEYLKFKESLRVASENSRIRGSTHSRKHTSNIQVIDDNGPDNVSRMPVLVYVSREKDPTSPHHFKAGAINVLIRVSGILSNAPYILVLDCDMYSNDPSSARHAMCFHLDQKIAPTLAFVQFPQMFHNVSKNDIYDGAIRSTFEILWPGFDGLGGPILTGTCFYIKRKALYGNDEAKTDPILLKPSYGASNEFLKSLNSNRNPHVPIIEEDLNDRLLNEANILASCFYEEDTEWGKQIGFSYDSVCEDYLTGFKLHCKGWKSVYYNPSRPAFLGSATTNLSDTLVQSTRWMSGLQYVNLSRFNPIIYGLRRMPLLHCMGYAYVGFIPLSCIPLYFYAFVPQLCLLKGVPLYPKVSSPWFILFSFVFSSSLAKLLYDIIETGGSIRMWWNEYPIWMMKSVTSFLYGSLDAIKKRVGFKKASFVPTNKVTDEEQFERDEMGVFDFQVSTMFLAPMVIIIILNMVSFVWGIAQVILTGLYEEMLGQIFISFFILVGNYPIVEGMLFRKDKGSIPPRVTSFSAAFVFVLVVCNALL